MNCSVSISPHSPRVVGSGRLYSCAPNPISETRSLVLPRTRYFIPVKTPYPIDHNRSKEPLERSRIAQVTEIRQMGSVSENLFVRMALCQMGEASWLRR